MVTTQKLANPQEESPVWHKYCGHLDLSLKEFMAIQEGLLLEELDMIGRSEVGRKFLGKARPRSVDEFRERVPLTSYSDYLPLLGERREDVLPQKPRVWCRTSGRSGFYDAKWVPYSSGMFAAAGRAALTGLIQGGANRKGEVNIKQGDTMLYTLAPPPYPTGAYVGPSLQEEFGIRFIPSLEAAERMSFQERMATGMRMAMREGVQLFMGIPPVLLRIAEVISGEAEGPKRRLSAMLHPGFARRMLGGVIRSKLAGRPLYPRDLWQPKSILLGGTEGQVYAATIKKYWGRHPMDIYASAESGAIGVSNWEPDSMSFFPDQCFLEFIPEEEVDRSREDQSYMPPTLLLDQVSPGIYELVITNFYGGALLRYRMGDLLRIVSTHNESLGIAHPQFVFHSRSDDIMDLGGFAKINERTVVLALADAQVPAQDWVAVREFDEEKPRLHLYLEPKGTQKLNQAEIAESIHASLGKVDHDYKDMEDMLRIKTLKVTLVQAGSFMKYMMEMEASGADLGHLKPIRMKPRQEQLDKLLSISAGHSLADWELGKTVT
ncbi:MAG: GH3 auxin-responsive promoter family protein [Dehalococcoidia bacterium]